MPQPTIAVIPLDDRAVNYECLALLGQAAGSRMIMPPKVWLGTPWRTGQMERLGVWLREVAPGADALIVALDTLGYGGLVDSRRSTASLETVLARLHLLRELKDAQPDLTILAYSVLMRVTRGNDAEEEKPYWGLYGARIFRMSVIEDRVTMAVATAAERAELAALRDAVPAEFVADYRQGRARNHAVNRAMIEWAAAGVFDYLIIPQDDTVDYGWNIAEGRALRQLVQQLGVTARVSIYPGADETDMLLLARYAAGRAGLHPKVWLRLSGSTAAQVITAYEDRPLTELVKAHLGPLGGILVDAPEAADLLLYVNAPAEVQGNGPDQYALLLRDDELAALPEPARQAVLAYRGQPSIADTLRELYTVRRDLPEFVRSLAAALAADHSCAVVDVAYVNAGDLALGELLASQVELSQLAAYAGWNTAGNSLGSALAQAVIRHLQRLHGATADALAAHARLLFLRLVEDYLFMGRLRTQIMLEELPLLGAPPNMANLGQHAEPVRVMAEARLRAAAQSLAVRAFVGRTLTAGDARLTIADLGVARLEMPWQRLFDITLEIVLT
jgi:hypothetical protein